MPLLALKVRSDEHSEEAKCTSKNCTNQFLLNYLYTKLAILPSFYVLITIVFSSSPRDKELRR